MGYYLASFQEDSSNQELVKSFKEAVELFSQHFHSYVSYDFNGNKMKTLGFEEGFWSEHPDFQYSLYEENKFPLKRFATINKNVGMDIAHAGTVVAFLGMLSSHKKEFDLIFPTAEQMEMFSNRFLYNVFNGDFKNPLFKNYMNGANGWFRVENSSGYAPYNLTSTALINGYPRLGEFNPKLKEISHTLNRKMTSDKSKDREFIQKFYQKTIWINGKQKNEYNFYKKEMDSHTALFLLNFYSSLEDSL